MIGLVVVLGCSGDPYARYAATVHQDVDGAMVAAFKMTARLQLTVVHNQIPDDSLAVAAAIVTRAARAVRERAVHFAAVEPPGDLLRVHIGLSAQLSQVAEAVDSMGAAFRLCADSAGHGDETACQAHLDSLNSRFGFVGEDLTNARRLVQRLLLSRGIMLRPISARGESPAGRTG